MFKAFTEQEVPKSILDMAYSSADSGWASKLLRICRWLLSVAMMTVLIDLIAVHGMSLRDNRHARVEWICFVVCSVGGYALYLLERRRKKRENENL